ncbi:hypothetical protein ACG2F4_01415 [Halalkalibaculum sp. DA3122]
MNDLRELTLHEYLEISGGKPDLNTSPFYDVGWYIGAAIREVESWFK